MHSRCDLFQLVKRCRLFGAVTMGLLCTGEVTSAQQFSTVQLPTFQRFSMTTSVLVPDQGSIYAGGIGHSTRTGSLRTGSGSVGTGGVTVSAFVHDFEALDAAVLAEARRNRKRTGRALPLATPAIADEVENSSNVIKVSDVRRQVQQNDNKRLARAQADFRLAQRLISKGKMQPARILLKNALKRADPNLRNAISEQLATLTETQRGIPIAATQRSRLRRK